MKTAFAIIDKLYCGPNNSGNGGYSCGLLAQFIRGPLSVRLQAPPPLDTPLQVEYNSEMAVLKNSAQTLATAKPASIDFEASKPISYTEAQRGAKDYIGYDEHLCPKCFVCGPERKQGDGLRIFAGKVEDNLVASPWRPHVSLCDSNGKVKPIYVWAALDCPGAFTFLTDFKKAVLLGELVTDIKLELNAEESCVVTGTHLYSEGRKHVVSTAVYNQAGALAAVAKGTWIELQQHDIELIQ